jgi:predicted N-acetyltransferase YhbS
MRIRLAMILDQEISLSATVPTEGPGVLLRAARREELGQVLDLLDAANQEYRAAMRPMPFEAYLQDLRTVRDRWDDVDVFVAEKDGGIVACVSFDRDAGREDVGLPSGCASFRALAVHPDARGLGLGRQLARLCLRRARKIGARTLVVHAMPFMTRTRRMYERLGFRRAPEWDGRVSAGSRANREPEDIVVLAYRLDL